MAIAELQEDEKNQVQTLRALMGLHGLTVSELSQRAFIPQENIEAFLSGATASLSDPSFKEAFRSMGMTESEELIDTRVHFWRVKMKRTRNKENLLPLNNMLKHIGNHSAMALSKKKNITPILVKAENIRIVLFVQTPMFMTVNVADLGLNPGAFAGNHKVQLVPQYYYDLISMRALRPNYFDLVLNGTYINEDIDLLRMVALEHDVTLSELVNHVVRNDRHTQQNNQKDSIQESQIISIHSTANLASIDSQALAAARGH